MISFKVNGQWLALSRPEDTTIEINSDVFSTDNLARGAVSYSFDGPYIANAPLFGFPARLDSTLNILDSYGCDMYIDMKLAYRGNVRINQGITKDKITFSFTSSTQGTIDRSASLKTLLSGESFTIDPGSITQEICVKLGFFNWPGPDDLGGGERYDRVVGLGVIFQKSGFPDVTVNFPSQYLDGSDPELGGTYNQYFFTPALPEDADVHGFHDVLVISKSGNIYPGYRPFIHAVNVGPPFGEGGEGTERDAYYYNIPVTSGIAVGTGLFNVYTDFWQAEWLQTWPSQAYTFPVLKVNGFYADKNDFFKASALINNQVFSSYLESNYNIYHQMTDPALGSRDVLAPSFFVPYIFKRIFEIQNVTISGDFFNNDDIKRLLLVSFKAMDSLLHMTTTDGNGHMTVIRNIHKKTIAAGDYVPDITVGDFLSALEAVFNITYVYNNTGNSYTVYFFSDILANKSYTDFTAYAENAFTLLGEDYTGYKFTYTKDDSDALGTEDTLSVDGGGIEVTCQFPAVNPNAEFTGQGLSDDYGLTDSGLTARFGFYLPEAGFNKVSRDGGTYTDFDLKWSGNRGIYAQFWADYVQKFKNQKKLKQSFLLPAYAVLNFKQEVKIKIVSNLFLVQNLHIKSYSPGLYLAEGELLKTD